MPLIDSSRLVPPPLRPAYRPLRPLLDAGLGLSGLNALYERCQGGPPEAFAERVLRDRGLTWELPSDELDRLQAIRGPLIVAANHPFGGPEALLLILLLARIRPDYRLLANHLLGAVPEMAPRLILVDPFGGKGAMGRNRQPLRRSLGWLAQGGLLALFPAGEVSALRWGARAVSDGPWAPQVAALARRSGATVLPLHFEGRNGAFFQAAGLVDPRLRTLLLPRAMLNPAPGPLRFRFGKPIPAQRLALWDDRQGAAYLRERCYLLGAGARPAPGPARPLAALAPALPAGALAADVAALTAAGARLAGQGRFSVLLFQAGQAPALMAETARLRERAFRASGEGTGQPSDRDAYDDEYQHLCLWDQDAGRVAGGYRLVEAGPQLRRRGPEGLYTHSLFRLRPAVLEQLQGAAELGRSFVDPDYQGDPLALALLWRGIGAWVAARPGITRLFGCVSISPSYHPLTQRLLVAFLRLNRAEPRAQAWVAPRLAYKAGALGAMLERALRLDSMHQLQELVDEVEQGRLRVPVLLKHYLKLGGRILAFNVDPGFNGTLDGLFMLDLRQCPPKMLERYLGPTAAADRQGDPTVRTAA